MVFLSRRSARLRSAAAAALDAPRAGRGRRCFALLASGVLLLPLAAQAFPARGGGGGTFGGGYHFGGGGAGSGGGDWRSGYQGSHPLYGSNTRSSWGGASGWGSNGAGGGGFDRGSLNNLSGNNDRYRLNNSGQINVTNDRNFYSRDFNGFNDGWRNGGYWNDRPWGAGWFVGGASAWGWYGANAAAWGLAGLATGAAIGSLVNAAAAQSSPIIVVPQTSYQLNYGSVESVGSYGVSFNYLVNGSQLLGAANCQQGLLNGQVPSNASQAQLLNAVCQVAYGSGT